MENVKDWTSLPMPETHDGFPQKRLLEIYAELFPDDLFGRGIHLNCAFRLSIVMWIFCWLEKCFGPWALALDIITIINILVVAVAVAAGAVKK